MSDLEEFRLLAENDELRKANEQLQVKLAKAKAKTDDLVQATIDGAKQAMLTLGPIKTPKPPAARKGKKAEVALWHLTDWQIAKVTPTYNSDIARERVLRFCEKAAKLTEIQRADHPVNECVICFGGDIGEGLFQYPHQPFEIDSSLFGQYVRGAQLCVEVVLAALATYPKITVISEWGNHGRVGSKRAVVPPADNFDRMTYELARQLLAMSDADVRWDDSDQDIQHVEIGNYRALLIHGDEIGRHGYASRNTIVQGVNRWRSGAHPWEFRDVYVGHYHNHGEDSLANGDGSVFWTGSPESDNRYASDRLAASSKPSQRLHFIDPVEGRVTAQFKVWLS
jgi:hypothetical protein